MTQTFKLTCSLWCICMGCLLPVKAANITFLPISGDADCGLSSGNNYTHAIDFGSNNPRATVNGVVFQPSFNGKLGTSATIGTGSTNILTDHAGNAGADAYLVDGGMEDLVKDFVYNNANAVIQLTHLTAGSNYQFKLYQRQWGDGDRSQDIGFDIDGVGSTIATAEETAVFDPDRASEPDASFGKCR
jgi:hypothetical protein